MYITWKYDSNDPLKAHEKDHYFFEYFYFCIADNYVQNFSTAVDDGTMKVEIYLTTCTASIL